MSEAHTQSAAIIEDAPETVQYEYSRLYRQRRVYLNPASWYVEYDDERDALSYCGLYVPHENKTRHLETWSESMLVGLIAKSQYWTNGAVLIRDVEQWYRRGSQIFNDELQELARDGLLGDEAEFLHLVYDPWLWHYPLVRLESFGLTRLYDSRYFDIAWTRFGEGVWKIDPMSQCAIYYNADAAQVKILPIRLSDNGEERVEQLMKRRREVCE